MAAEAAYLARQSAIEVDTPEPEDEPPSAKPILTEAELAETLELKEGDPTGDPPARRA